MNDIEITYEPELAVYRLNRASGWVTDLNEEEARDLIRGLVKAGVSMQFPDTSFSAGKLSALEQHLADMRRIVFEDKS